MQKTFLISKDTGGYAIRLSGTDGKAWPDGKAKTWGAGAVSDRAEDEGTANGFSWKEDIVGLRLDLDNGTLDMEGIKNADELGVIFTGLRGPLCWAAELWYGGDCVALQKPPAGPPQAQTAASLNVLGLL